MMIERLVAELDAADAVPTVWRTAFLAVPRHAFLPPQVWVDDEQGKPQPLSRNDDPDRWLEAAYRMCRSSSSSMTARPGGGAQGHPANAPYERVIATAAVRVGELPYSWVAQTRPGGVIVIPMRTDFGGSVPLVRFMVDEDGTAAGRPVGRVGFMAVRNQRTPEWTLDHLDPDDPTAELSTTTLKPWRVAKNHDVRWAIGTRVPRCVWEHQPPTDDRKHHLLGDREKPGLRPHVATPVFPGLRRGRRTQGQPGRELGISRQTLYQYLCPPQPAPT
jgi:protein-L-isoaspartate O-methyltransferase